MSTLRKIMTMMIWTMMIKMYLDRNQATAAHRQDIPTKCTDKMTEINQITVKGTIMSMRTESELNNIQVAIQAA